MKYYHINFLHKNNYYWRVLFGSTLCELMEQLRPKTNPLAILFWFLSLFNNIMYSLCLKTITMKQDHIKFLDNKKGGMVTVFWENIVPAHGAATA